MDISIRPGDCFVYRPSSWLGRLIAVKSWSNWSHVEIVTDANHAIGARPEGVNRYPLRWDNLGCIVRPDPVRFDFDGGMAWFEAKAKGQAYDVFGLMRFFTIGKQSEDKMFCSEMATRFYRHAGFPELFHTIDADLVPPGWFVTLADGFTTVWSDGKP